MRAMHIHEVTSPLCMIEMMSRLTQAPAWVLQPRLKCSAPSPKKVETLVLLGDCYASWSRTWAAVCCVLAA